MALFAADENVSLPVVQMLRSNSHDVLSFAEHGLKGTLDHAVLFRAGREGGTVISHNFDDFILLHDVWRLWSAEWNVRAFHGRILLIPHRYHLSTAEIVREVGALIAADLPVANELYVWHRQGGWVRRQA